MRKVVICEDVELQREMLKDILIECFEEMNETAEILTYSSGESLLEDAKEGYVKADLLFLDIHMKELNGMDVARQYREHMSQIPIIFITGTSDFAVESYEVHAAAYLLKPYDKVKLKHVLQQVLEVDNKRRIEVKTKRQYRYPYVDEIMYIESCKHNITIHLQNGARIVTAARMNEIEEKLNDTRFLRCNQSFLVNMDYIKDVKEDFILKDGTEIPIRVRGRKEMIDCYHDYFKKNYLM